MDEVDIVQVGGRLDQAELPYDAAHPMYMSKEHYIAQLIVAEVHYFADIWG